MTEDTENRVNTPGGGPEENGSESGAAETENPPQKTGAEHDIENDSPQNDTGCVNAEDSGGSPESGDAAAEEDSDTAGSQGSESKSSEDDVLDKIIKENDDLKKSLGAAEEQLKKQKDMFMRTVAEYDNYRKRTEREKSAIYSDATAATVKEILTVEDNLSRALEQKDCSADDLRKGVEMVEKQMQKALSKLGVTEMGKEGETFDPALHNAVSHIEDENIGENTIAEVFQKGYMIGGKVVRHAMVKVAN